MKTKMLTALIMSVLYLHAAAQFNYSYSVSQQTYTPLTGTTSVNGATKWNDEKYKVPLGFNFTFNGTTILNSFSLTQESFATDTTNPFSGFGLINADMWDRANAASGASVSPIRYVVTGTTGSRIFKLEKANAGFAAEKGTFSTNNDSVSMQIWLYEGSNIVEIRFGPSNVNHATTYFKPSGKPTISFIKDLLANGSFTKAYYFKGSPSSPNLDSALTVVGITTGLDTFPQNGKVYRFTPKPTSVENVSHKMSVSVINTSCTDILNIQNGEIESLKFQIISLNGVVLTSGTLKPGTTSVDVSMFPSALYGVQFISSSDIKFERFTKI